MKQFLKFVLATIIGLVLFVGIFFIFLMSAVQGIGEEKEVIVADQSILHLKLNYQIRDKQSDNPFEKLAALNGDVGVPLGMNEIIYRINRAANDSKIKGIFLDLTFVGAGYAKTSEIREALLNFKKKEKFIYAYSENYYNTTYYLASVADKVYINPKGTFLFNGMAADVTFIKSMLEKVGVEMQVIKRGKFKGAVEPYVLNEMSQENREQIGVYVNSIFDQMLTAVSTQRSIAVDSLKRMANDFDVRTAEQAVNAKLMDGMRFKDEVVKEMAEKLNIAKSEDMDFVKLSEYKGSRVSEKSSNIAIVYAEGTIVSGYGEDGEVGSDRFAKALKDAREDKSVKAVVLRVNSPGGSALASEVILREAALFKGLKPLIVSMGDVAASGGYYISCAADTIVAQAQTITGSIGVFGLVPNASGLMKKIGLHTEYVGTGDHSEFGRIDRAMTEKEFAVIDEFVGTIYSDFLSHVATARNMSVASVDSIAQGRVWTGIMAKDLGLVDVIGGLDRAIEIAAYKANVTDYGLKSYPVSKNQIEAILEVMNMSTISQKIIAKELGSNYAIYKNMKSIENLKGPQMLMPYSVNLN